MNNDNEKEKDKMFKGKCENKMEMNLKIYIKYVMCFGSLLDAFDDADATVVSFV